MTTDNIQKQGYWNLNLIGVSRGMKRSFATAFNTDEEAGGLQTVWIQL